MTRCSQGRLLTSQPNCGRLTNTSSCAVQTVLVHTATKVRCINCTRRSSTTLPRRWADRQASDAAAVGLIYEIATFFVHRPHSRWLRLWKVRTESAVTDPTN